MGLFRQLGNTIPTTPLAAGKKWSICEPRNTNLMAYAMPFQSNAWVKNSCVQATFQSEYDTTFAPLDHNFDYEKTLRTTDNRCDGIIYTTDGKVIVFVELKDRECGSDDLDLIASQCVEVNSRSSIDKEVQDEWLPKGVIQLAETVKRFRISNPNEASLFLSVHRAYLANRKLTYNTEFAAECTKAAFEKETGFKLRINNHIEVRRIPPPIRLKLDSNNLIKEMTE